MFTGERVLLEACLKDDMSYRRMFLAFFSGRHEYYREDMSYWRTYLTRRTYITGRCVLLEDMSYWINVLQ